MKMLILIVALAATALSARDLASAPQKPNVLFSVIDDWNDWTTLSDKSNLIQTPNLERLAARGMFWVQGYQAAAIYANALVGRLLDKLSWMQRARPTTPSSFCGATNGKVSGPGARVPKPSGLHRQS